MTEKKSSIKKNLSYQTIYHVILTILPLITAPYLARTLGVTKQGIFSYTNSIVSYFTLFAMLGIANHGTRCIAQHKDEYDKRSNKFSSIFTVQLLSSGVAMIVYLFYLVVLCKENQDISLIQTISIIACFLDINWLFLGMEDFKFVVIRNTIIRIIIVFLIMILVKKPSDLWIYALLMSGAPLISNCILWMKYHTYIHFTKPKITEIKEEIKPILILFIPLLAMSFYHIMDKTMLGILSTYEEVGYYYNADKVINIPIGIITGISAVLFPRSVIYLQKSKEVFIDFFKKGLEGIIVVSVALSFGIASISNEFTPFFFGSNYSPCIILIIVLSPVMIVKAVSSIVRYQYLIPKKKEKYFIYSVFSGAIVNFIVNLLLIPKYGSMGAVIGTLAAETISCLMQFIFIKKDLNIIKVVLNTICYLLIGICMFAIVRYIASILSINIITKIIFEVLSGGIVYIVLVLLFWKITNTKIININIFKNHLNINKEEIR